MELLAPAGSLASFEAALEEGADAIYVGAPGLNARALTRDFSYQEIGAMIEEAHRHKVRLYIAMNSLIKEDELRQTVEGLAYFNELKPDALIIQDLGLYNLARTYFPEIPLHASTLMHGHNAEAVVSLIEMGFKRVVLPRELTVQEIGSIYRKTRAELEIFVHGAMCFSFSGLCLFSSLHGGKSSLRGQCVQPCRRKYSLVRKGGRSGTGKKMGKAQGKGGGYLFSMNDLSGIDLLPQIKKAGVHCLKVEGRLKSAEYVRKTIRAYRLMLDTLHKGAGERQKAQNEAHALLDDAMGRRRSTGFFKSHQPDSAVTPHLSGNVGKMVGRVSRLELSHGKQKKKTVEITVSLRQPIQTGERFRLHDEKSGERISFTPQTIRLGNRSVQQARSGQIVKMLIRQEIPVLTTRNFQGSLFRVDIGPSRKGKNEITRHKQKINMPVKRIRQKMDTVFNALPVSISSDSLETRGSRGRRQGKNPSWWVRVNSFRDLKVKLPVRPEQYVLPLTRENVLLAEEIARTGRRGPANVAWSLPPVILAEETDWFIRKISFLAANSYSVFMLGHFTQMKMFSGPLAAQPALRLFVDYTCNLLNSLSMMTVAEKGFSGGIFSIETDGKNLARSLDDFYALMTQAADKHSGFAVGVYIYGHPPLFTSRLDDSHFKYGKKVASPRGEEYILSRQNNTTVARSALPFSAVDLWRDIAGMGVDFCYVDLSGISLRRALPNFTSLYNRKGKIPVMTGNFKGELV